MFLADALIALFILLAAPFTDFSDVIGSIDLLGDDSVRSVPRIAYTAAAVATHGPRGPPERTEGAFVDDLSTTGSILDEAALRGRALHGQNRLHHRHYGNHRHRASSNKMLNFCLLYTSDAADE